MFCTVSGGLLAVIGGPFGKAKLKSGDTGMGDFFRSLETMEDADVVVFACWQSRFSVMDEYTLRRRR
jgi:hypothetical protein